MWDNVVSIFLKYSGSGLLIIWFLIAWVYLLIKEKDTNVRILFVYVPALVLLIYFNPLFSTFFYRMVGEETYFRIIWLVPYSMVIAYAGVDIYKRYVGLGKAFAGISIAVLIAISGHFVYNNQLFSPAENEFHVPDYVVDICDAVEVEGREVMVAFPNEFLLYVRQYSPLICMPYGRESLGGYNSFNVLMNSDKIDVEAVAKECLQSGCHYIVVSEDKEMMGDWVEAGFEIYDKIDGYTVYRYSHVELVIPN